ncbi:MAG: DUF59 domain-containing protein [Chloroflexi bacterium]|nr:DUF59 domain-containing protein [Chloroflexota bacterium]
MVTREEVIEALKDCYDPEIPVNIVDLGLIYDVETEGDRVHVEMTLTAPGCPLHESISRDVRERLLKIEGVSDAEVEMVWDPPWTYDRMSQEAKEALGLAR